MEKFENILVELRHKFIDIDYDGDLGDIGNEIGVVIGKHIEKDIMGYDIKDFNDGLKHGISLSNGTHK